VKRPWGIAAVAVLVGGLARLLLLDWAGSVAVALVVVAIALAVQRADPEGEPLRWLPERAPRAGERREALLLTWALAGYDGRVSRRALQQVQDVGTHRLARHGLDLASAGDEAALRALVGPRALATLRCAREPWPRLADVVHTITVLDRIGPGRPARVTTPSRSNPR
jgi:hypothetical protein